MILTYRIMKTKHSSRIYPLFMMMTILLILSCVKEDPVVVTGNIEGTVSDVDNDNAIQGVNVHLVANASSTFIEQSKATGADGKFSFKSLDAGSYKLSFQKEGYEDNSKNITLLAGQTSSSDIGLKPIKPVLSVSKSELNFGKTETNLTFSIKNIGKGELIWEVKESIAWLIVNPSSDIATTETDVVSVILNREDAEPGDQEGIISVTSNGGTSEILIKVIIEGPNLNVSPPNLDFGIDYNKKTLLLSNTGVGSLDYSLFSDDSWISINQITGSLTNDTDPIEITVNRNGLDYREYNGTINIISNANSVAVDVKMIVPNPNLPQLSISPKELNFGKNIPNANLTIQNTGRGILEWSLIGNQPWINVSKNSNNLTANQIDVITVSVNRTGLAPNVYSGFINVTSNGGNETCNILMEIPSEPILYFEPNVLNFGHDKESLPFTIQNIGTGNLNWDLTKNKDWISISEASGTNQSTINVTVDRNQLDYLLYSGQIDISSNGGTAAVVINVEKRKPNTPPVVDVTVNPTSGYLEDNFTLNVICSDDYTTTDNLLVRWKWQDEDAFSNWATDKSSSHMYTSSGTKNITVEVKDEDGLTSSLSKSVVVNKNEKPTASFTVTPASGTINTIFTVDANESSDDFTSKENLQVRWNWGDSQDFTAWTTSKDASHTYTLAGNWTITLEVKDEAGLTNSTSRNVTILASENEPNGKPTDANLINVNSTIIGQSDYLDFFKFTPTENGNFIFSIKNNGTSFSSISGYLLNYYEDPYLNYENVIIQTYNPVWAGERFISSKVPVSAGLKYLIALSGSGNDPYELTTIFVPISQTDFGEPNNFIDNATSISLNSTVTALIGYSDDLVDYYKITPTENGNFSFSVKNLHHEEIREGTIGDCSLYQYGNPNALATIRNIYVTENIVSNTITLSKDIQYIIKIPKYYGNNAAPYELTTFFNN